MVIKSATHNPQVPTRNPQPATHTLTSRLIEKAKHLGFLAVGFSRPERPVFFDPFCDWIAAQRQGDMRWIGRHLDLRENPKMLLKGCQTIVSLAYPYSSKKPCTPDGFTTARYTQPKKLDYHDQLRELGRRLSRIIVEVYPESRIRICVDSAPILERNFAYTSGMGFIGKNNMFIIPGYGSYFFLMEILTTAPLPLLNDIPVKSRCGTCTQCIDACPTGALESPYSLNASKCLSYLTIEQPGAVDSQAGRSMNNCFFGCDVCQEVCPFNTENDLRDFSLPSTDELLGMDADSFKAQFGKTAFARAGLEKIKSNIKAIRSAVVR
jgi:epoxyqueuosine reductase